MRPVANVDGAARLACVGALEHAAKGILTAPCVHGGDQAAVTLGVFGAPRLTLMPLFPLSGMRTRRGLSSMSTVPQASSAQAHLGSPQLAQDDACGRVLRPVAISARVCLVLGALRF